MIADDVVKYDVLKLIKGLVMTLYYRHKDSMTFSDVRPNFHVSILLVKFVILGALWFRVKDAQ